MVEQKINKKPTNFTVVHIIIILLFGCFMIVSLINAIKSMKQFAEYSNGNFVLEQATIVKYDDNTDTGKLVHYFTLYEYEADDGTIYYGCWERLIKDEEYAKAQIGKKVPIYVDHNLKVHLLSLNFDTFKVNVWIYGIITIITFILFANSSIRVAIKFVSIRKEKGRKQ